MPGLSCEETGPMCTIQGPPSTKHVRQEAALVAFMDFETHDLGSVVSFDPSQTGRLPIAEVCIWR